MCLKKKHKHSYLLSDETSQSLETCQIANNYGRKQEIKLLLGKRCPKVVFNLKTTTTTTTTTFSTLPWPGPTVNKLQQKNSTVIIICRKQVAAQKIVFQSIQMSYKGNNHRLDRGWKVVLRGHNWVLYFHRPIVYCYLEFERRFFTLFTITVKKNMHLNIILENRRWVLLFLKHLFGDDFLWVSPSDFTVKIMPKFWRGICKSLKID